MVGRTVLGLDGMFWFIHLRLWQHKKLPKSSRQGTKARGRPHISFLMRRGVKAQMESTREAENRWLPAETDPSVLSFPSLLSGTTSLSVA